MMMPDREKAVNAFVICMVNGRCSTNCPYWDDFPSVKGCTKKLATDIYSLLKEQEEILRRVEPRVLTREEMKKGVEDHRPVFVEEWTEGAEPRCFWGLIERGFEPPEHGYNYPGGVDFNVVDTSQDMWDGDFYGMNSTLGWRAWTTEPSEELRKAVPWSIT